MIGAVGSNTQFLALTQTTASLAYLDCYDLTSFDYDSYNNILWVGNSLGELHGYTIVLSNSGERREKKSDPDCVYRESKQIPVLNLTQTTDIDKTKKLTSMFSGGTSFPDFKSMFHYLFQVSSSVVLETDKTMFESKTSLVSMTHDFSFCTEGGKVTKVRSSMGSNVVMAANSSSVVTLWDFFDRCVLLRVNPPHFTQSIVLQTVDDKSKLDFRKFLNKDFVSVQPILYFSYSVQNEDFLVVSQDYISMYSLGGVLVASERRTKKQDRFVCGVLLDVSWDDMRTCILLMTTLPWLETRAAVFTCTVCAKD